MDKSTKKRATITQVAKHAGVSVGTVSNYLNGTAGVSHDRAARIQQAIVGLYPGYSGEFPSKKGQHSDTCFNTASG